MKLCCLCRDMILKCLEDKDESIRLRCLDLIYGMVSRKNLTEIIKKLMVHVDHAEGAGLLGTGSLLLHLAVC